MCNKSPKDIGTLPKGRVVLAVITGIWNLLPERPLTQTTCGLCPLVKLAFQTLCYFSIISAVLAMWN